MEYNRRKSPRLKGFDYNTPGMYFVTVCTYKMRMLFWDNPTHPKNDNFEYNLNFAGKIANETIKSLPNQFPVEIQKYVVMPNHIHIILLVKSNCGIKTLTGIVSRSIGYLKMRISHKLREFNVDDVIWQRSFHDHIIRTEREYQRIWDYIENNPAEWENDCFFDSAT